jgi:hypothetical protein
MATQFRGKAYLKEGCPYLFKFLLFMAAAGLLDSIEIHRCDPHSRQFEEEKAHHDNMARRKSDVSRDSDRAGHVPRRLRSTQLVLRGSTWRRERQPACAHL